MNLRFMVVEFSKVELVYHHNDGDKALCRNVPHHLVTLSMADDWPVPRGATPNTPPSVTLSYLDMLVKECSIPKRRQKMHKLPVQFLC